MYFEKNKKKKYNIKIKSCYKVPGKNRYAVEFHEKHSGIWGTGTFIVYINDSEENAYFNKKEFNEYFEDNNTDSDFRKKIYKYIKNHSDDWCDYGYYCDSERIYDHFLFSEAFNDQEDKRYEFLPVYDEKSKHITKEGFETIVSFITANPTTLPLFLYAVLSFMGDALFRYPCWEDTVFKTIDRISADETLHKGEGDDIHKIDFSLWAYSKNYGDAKRATGLFLNMFQWIRSGFSKNDVAIINTKANLSVHDIREHEKTLSDAPMIVFSSDKKINPMSKTVQQIISDKWEKNISCNPVFVSGNSTKNDLVLNAAIDPFILNYQHDRSEAYVLYDVKNNLNVLYRDFMEYILVLYRKKTSRILYDGEESIMLNRKVTKLAESSLAESIHKPVSIYRAAYVLCLYKALYLFADFLENNDIPNEEIVSLSKESLTRLLNGYRSNKKKETNTSDIEAFKTKITSIIAEGMQDENSEIVWRDKHKVKAGTIVKIYCISSHVLDSFFKNDISVKPRQLKAMLANEGILIKNDQRYVFEKTIHSKKRYFYKIPISKLGKIIPITDQHK